ncbi:MAG: uridine kinase [Candidatus Eisenbacteria bacterium]|uniref:Uridine kinase n=1 Tax=Eiseniibacteriota bacterium TaxID=2212470 RepID=A0A956NDA1_UNCEI|nr:uridine kinase [Candidatus Eisenbacteria bacterium]MCB9462498.1 uridine kinase [Candidatus Eisenbacteria bacterium]
MPKRVVIGIAGGTASGKTLVASRIREAIGVADVAFLKMDAYYKDLRGLSAEERARQNFDHPDAFDVPLLVRHLEALLAGRGIDEPIYDFTNHARKAETRRVESGAVIVVEGILVLFERALRELMDIKIYVQTDPDVRLIRRIRRDVQDRGRTVQSVLDQYERSVRPMHEQFIEPSKRYADVIIPEGGNNRVAVDLLTTKIAAVLALTELGKAQASPARQDAGGSEKRESLDVG